MDDLLSQVTHVVDVLVGSSSLLVWALFIPQIRRIWKLKEANSISLITSWGTWVLQMLILVQSLLYSNWYLALTMGMSVTLVTIMNMVVHYYRAFPGGRGLT